MVKRRIDISQYWRKLSINAKFRVAFGTLLILIVLIAATSVVVLKSVQYKTETAIVISTEIQRLVLGMDRALYKARSLEKNFFLRYPTIGYSAAYQKYAQQANKQIKNVRALSIKLQQLIAESDVSDAWSESAVNLNLYLLSARRHMVTVKEAEGLIARLATDETGLQDELARISSLLQSALQIADDPDLMVLYHEMQSFEKNYLITRQRPLMQSAFNTAIPLQKAIKVTPTFEAGHKTKVLTYLDNYLAIAEEILDLDIAIRSKFNEFDLETEAVDPISKELINLVNQEIERARTQIGNRGKLSMIILVATSLVGLALSGIIVLVLNKSITLNVIKLTEVTGEFQAGNTEVRARIDSADELGKLADTFNAMATSISSLVGNLEQKVSERTSQLTKTNEQLMQEIKERKGVEEALKKSELWIRNIFKSLKEAVFVITPDRIFLDMNEAGLEMFGYTREELVNLPSDIAHLDHEHYLEFGKKMEEVLNTGGITNFQFKMRRKNGEIFPTEHTASLMVDNEGKPVGIVSVIRDLSEQKKIEEEKEKLQTQLQQAQKMETIATLAGGIAHEFNNALTGVVGNIELLEMRLPDDKIVTEHTEAMKSSSHRMANLTSQLLAYARGGRYQAKTMSLSDFVEDTLPIIKSNIDPSIRLETDLPMDVFNVKADPTQMQMVLSAIVDNSSEAIEREGRIRVITSNEEIDAEFAKSQPELNPGRYVCLTVEDDGKGMDTETLNKIFDPFYTTKFTGRGLGMAAVYGIIQNHGGLITVDSELNKGTIIRVYLPAVEAAEIKKEATVESATEMPKGEGTILIIEDEETVMNVIRAVLERLGYRMLEAKTGREAVEIAETFDGDIDLALLDIKLPDIRGDKVYPLIMEARPNLKVIVCSGYSIDSARGILDAGAQDFIQKPFNVKELSQKLRKILEQE